MSIKYDSFRASINSSIKSINSPLFSELNRIFKSETNRLYEEDILAFENDYTLTGFPLECRVKRIFTEFNFSINRGKDGMEDFIVKPPPDFKIKKPLVIEVKSSRKPNIQRNQLRQLDDWVFETSGEQHARKHGLPGAAGVDGLAIVSHGLITKSSQPRYHPTPHKGVFIFNGPVTKPFTERNSSCLSQNDIEFVKRRDFCILPFDVLVNYSKESMIDPKIKEQFWEKIHNTSGLLLDP